MTQTPILLSLSVLPVMLLAMFVYRKDKFEKEPPGMLTKAFLFGCLSILPASIQEVVMSSGFELIFGSNTSGVIKGIFTGYFVAGLNEEFCKLCFLFWAVWWSRHFNEYFDGIVYAAFVSLGFAGVENILYIFQQDTLSSSLLTGTMRALLAVPAHFLFAVVMGYYFALAKFHPADRKSNLFKALIYPVLLHGTYDALLMIPGNMVNVGTILPIVFFAVFIYFDVKLWKIGMRRLNALQKLDEAAQEAGTTQEAGGENFTYSAQEEPPSSTTDNTENNNPFAGFDWTVPNLPPSDGN